MTKEAAALLTEWKQYESTVLQQHAHDFLVETIVMSLVLSLILLVGVYFILRELLEKKGNEGNVKPDKLKRYISRFLIFLSLWAVIFLAQFFLIGDDTDELKHTFFLSNEEQLIQYKLIEKKDLKSLDSSDRLYYAARIAFASGGERKYIRYAIDTDKGIEFEELSEDSNTIYYKEIQEDEKPSLHLYQKQFISDELKEIFYDELPKHILTDEIAFSSTTYGDKYYVFYCPKETLQSISEKFEVK